MIHRFKYILSFLLLLSLIGLGEYISEFNPKVKYRKETEWVSKTNLNEKESKCFSYSQYIFDTDVILKIESWSNEDILYYNQKVNVQLISLTKIFCEIDLINLIINKLYIPRKSIESHNFFC